MLRTRRIGHFLLWSLMIGWFYETCILKTAKLRDYATSEMGATAAKAQHSNNNTSQPPLSAWR